MAAITPLAHFFRPAVFCGARRKQGPPGATCRRPAGWGTGHVGVGQCKLHGGCTPTHGVAAASSLARRTAQIFGSPRDDVTPIEGLLEDLQRSAGLIDSYEAMAVQLQPDEVVRGEISREESRTVDPNVKDETGAGPGTDLAPVETKVRTGAAVNVWVKLLNEERDRFAKLCETMMRLDLDSRRVALGQHQVSALVAVLLSPELELSADQKRAAARMLREIDSRGEAIEGEVVP